MGRQTETRQRDGARPRASLSRDRVLAAAMTLADAEGLGAVTMRRLAQELGVEAMTLYYHVANKEEILDGLVDLVVREFEIAPPDAGWRAALHAMAMSAYEALGRHPWAAALALSMKRPSPARLRHMESILRVLVSAGLDEEDADRAYHVIEGHVMGFTLWEVGMDLGGPEELAALATGFLAELPRDEYPHVAGHVEHHLRQRRPGDRGSFEFGLDLILDGLERMGRDRPAAG